MSNEVVKYLLDITIDDTPTGYTFEKFAPDDKGVPSLKIDYTDSVTKQTKTVLDRYYIPSTVLQSIEVNNSHPVIMFKNIDVLRLDGVHYFVIQLVANPTVSYWLVYQNGDGVQSRDLTSDIDNVKETIQDSQGYTPSGEPLLLEVFKFESPDGPSKDLQLTFHAGGVDYPGTLNLDLYYDPVVIGSVGGDPYIFPLYGRVVKLPNCDNFYRLLQIPSIEMVINATVSRATPEQRDAIRDQTTGLIDYADAIDDGYFLSQIFVKSQEAGDLTINLEPGSNVLSRTDLPWTEAGIHTGQNTTGLLQGTYQARTVQVGPVTLEVRIFTNAQIRNEVVVSLTGGTCPADTSGLLYRNYRPNLFQLGFLTSTKIQTRYLKSRRALTQKAPVNQFEYANHLLVQQG